MSDWIGNAISILALAVSGCSLLISWRTSQRAANAERVTGWIDLQSTQSKEFHLATLTVKNQSRIDIRLQKISIDVPDYRLANLIESSVDDGNGNLVLPAEIKPKEFSIAMPCSPNGDIVVHAGTSGQMSFLIYQPLHSQRKTTVVNAMFWTLEPKPKWNQLPIKVKTRTDF